MKDNLLESFMKEHFPFTPFKNIGLFSKEMKGDYKAQSERVCKYFGYRTVYEYGKEEIRCHITHDDPKLSVDDKGELKEEPFVTVIPSIYD